MIYGPLDVEDAAKYKGKQVKLADNIKALRNNSFVAVQKLQELPLDYDEEYPYNGYRYMEPLEEKTPLDFLIENLKYLQQVYTDCVNSLEEGEERLQMEEILTEIDYLLTARNKVDFVTKLFPEYFNITEVDTGNRITSIGKVDLDKHSYKATILVR